jgi:hypothetical protein
MSEDTNYVVGISMDGSFTNNEDNSGEINPSTPESLLDFIGHIHPIRKDTDWLMPLTSTH